MILLTLIICFIFLMMLILKAFTKQIRQRKSKLKIKRIFADLYANIDGAQLSKKERALLKMENDNLVYGEICFDSFAMMLAVVQPKATDVFYDLGSGIGKAVFCSALLYPWKKCCGIELLPGLHRVSIDLLEKCNSLSDLKAPIEFIQGNLLENDFSDATVIFINATGFTAECWRLIMNKLHALQKGARIIVSSKKISESLYQLLDAKMYWMSWGWASVYIYQKN